MGSSHPVFSRVYQRFAAAMERRGADAHRHSLLAGLQGEVIEIGAGHGPNFAHYPSAIRAPPACRGRGLAPPCGGLPHGPGYGGRDRAGRLRRRRDRSVPFPRQPAGAAHLPPCPGTCQGPVAGVSGLRADRHRDAGTQAGPRSVAVGLTISCASPDRNPTTVPDAPGGCSGAVAGRAPSGRLIEWAGTSWGTSYSLAPSQGY